MSGQLFRLEPRSDAAHPLHRQPRWIPSFYSSLLGYGRSCAWVLGLRWDTCFATPWSAVLVRMLSPSRYATASPGRAAASHLLAARIHIDAPRSNVMGTPRATTRPPTLGLMSCPMTRTQFRRLRCLHRRRLCMMRRGRPATITTRSAGRMFPSTTLRRMGPEFIRGRTVRAFVRSLRAASA